MNLVLIEPGEVPGAADAARGQGVREADEAGARRGAAAAGGPLVREPDSSHLGPLALAGSGSGFVLELSERRATHLLDVVRVAPGSRLRVGITGGGLGHAEVEAAGQGRCTLRVVIDRPPPPQLPVHLLLAIPRPKVLLRTIAIAASFGVERIDLTNSWRVDKSYLGSPALSAESLGRAARDGAEQGATSRLPTIAVHRRLMSLLDAYPGETRDPSRLHLLAHPGVSRGLETVAAPGDLRPVTVAVGPEGGWIARELLTFEARGFSSVSLGESILRVEAAIASLLGQLQLLRRMPPSLA